MSRGNETTMHCRNPQALESKFECGVLSQGVEQPSAPWYGTKIMRRIGIGLGLLIAASAVAGCSGDDNNPGAGTSGSGGATSSGGTGGSTTGGTGGTTTGGTGGSGGSGADDAGDLDGFVSCAPSSYPVDTYHANLTKLGSNGVLTFTLVESDNAPPVRPINSWKLKITRADKSPVTGEVTGDASMPLHMHPAGVEPEVTFDPGLGMYLATPVYFFMPGYWLVSFTAYETTADAGVALDKGNFYFCVD